jgi:hypothetical protein
MAKLCFIWHWTKSNSGFARSSRRTTMSWMDLPDGTRRPMEVDHHTTISVLKQRLTDVIQRVDEMRIVNFRWGRKAGSNPSFFSTMLQNSTCTW